MPSVFISGANRGIGLEFARQYAADGWRVHAAARDLSRAEALRAIGGEIAIHELDVTSEAAVARVAAALKGQPLDLVIANAGVVGPRGQAPHVIATESWVETFLVNAVGAVTLASALKDNLVRGKLRKAIAVSSLLSSIGGNESGGHHVYRASKAALNAAWHALGIDWRAEGICCALVTPGWVRTDMGGPNADLTPTESVTLLRAIIDRLTLADAGKFFGHQGNEIPW